MDTRDTKGMPDARTVGRELRAERLIERDVRDVRTPAERAAVNDQTATDTRAEGNANGDIDIFRSAQPMLADRGRRRIVLQSHGDPQPTRNLFSK